MATDALHRDIPHTGGTSAARPPPNESHAAKAQPEGVYTCPMHPEIRQDQPGDCPKCGMTLEPVLPTVSEGQNENENKEFADFQRRFYWPLPLTVVVFVLAMFGHGLALFERGTQNWIELAVTAPVVLWAGWPFFVRGVKSFVHRSPNMWTLISLGTGSAFVYRVVATVVPQVFPASFVANGHVAVYAEAAAVINQIPEQ